MRIGPTLAMSGILLLSASALAQSSQQAATGVVTGRVQDVSGGAIPGGTVYLEREGISLKTTSNSTGQYTIADVPPGKYRIEIYLTGFRPFSRSDVVVTAASTTSVDGKLRINGGRPDLPPSGWDPVPPTQARAVYEVILPHIYKNAAGDMRVVRTSLVPAVLPREAWTGTFAPVAELRPTLERAAEGAPVFFRPEAFPSEVKLVTAHESGQRTTSFTPVFFTADGRRAVVYYEHYCGSLCGEGTMVWLTRTDAGVWQISGSRLFWVS